MPIAAGQEAGALEEPLLMDNLVALLYDRTTGEEALAGQRARRCDHGDLGATRHRSRTNHMHLTDTLLDAIARNNNPTGWALIGLAALLEYVFPPFPATRWWCSAPSW